ncbi:MAG: pyridoxal phosphate-dependent aminotransferase [Methylococcaceae bacterium]|nr:MAG: pyridoxal phosphate-dependent aminotransferase [Methylococcaceae bacterium]
MANIQAPIIPVVGQWLNQCPGAISLGQGVAFYGPPQQALQRARLFGEPPDVHKYGPVQGQPALLELLRAKLVAENAMDLRGREVLVTAGANMAFLNALFAIADPGDEIILPLPYYFNQEMAVRMVGCSPVLVPTDGEYQLALPSIQAAITPRTRAIVTVSPNNPSGAVYRPEDLAAVNALCRQHGIYHLCDEAYENFVYGQASHYSPGSLADTQGHTLSLYSLSKAYGFASWRIGYMVVPQHLYPALLKVQDTNLICATRIAQEAAVGALQVGSEYCRRHLPTLQQVRSQVLDALQALQGCCRIPVTDGAFYLLLKVDTRMDAMTLAERLVREYGVAAIPGNAFGLRDGCYLRLSYGALQPETAAEGVQRLVRGISRLAAEH